MVEDQNESKPRYYNFLGLSELQGNEYLKLILLLLAIDPSIDGLVILGETGVGKSQFLRGFSQMKIPLQKIENCPYNCSFDQENLCSSCLKRVEAGIRTKVWGFSPLIFLPPHASIEAIIGSFDIKLTFRPGILGRVNNGYLLIDDLHLLPPNILNIILEIWKNHTNIIQRDMLSFQHPSNFCLISSINTGFSDISSSILDKFAFSYRIQYDNTINQRIDILERNISPNGLHFSLEESKFNKIITNSRILLQNVIISKECLNFIASLCLRAGLQGQRADIALARGARALASLDGRSKVIKEDIILLAPFVLNHRVSNEKIQILQQLIKSEMPSSQTDSTASSEINLSRKLPYSDESHLQKRRIIEWFASILGITVGAYLIAIILVTIFSVPEMLLKFFSIIVLWGFSSFLLFLWFKRRQKIMEEHGILTKNMKKPNITSFSRVKSLKLTEKTKEAKTKPKTEIILDIEENRSKKGGILRFFGLRQRRGMISPTERQRFWLSIYGIIILLVSIILYTYLILILPPEFWLGLIFFFLCLVTIGVISALMKKQWQIKRVADIGASPSETSIPLESGGIGSHISPKDSAPQIPNRTEEYGLNLMDKLKDLNLVKSQSSEEKDGIPLIASIAQTSKETKPVKVVFDSSPSIKSKPDSKIRSKIGKRALSITGLDSGRVIGHQDFKIIPKNMHILATIKNAILRNYREGLLQKGVPFSIEKDDIRENVYCTRVSATIIFVLDLSESIVNTIKSVSDSVTWLSRQAYLYRDRVGVVVLQGTQGVIIQPPTSNLNLVKRKLMDLRASGSTPLPGGLQKALELIKLDRIRSKHETIPMIILITDGATNIPLLVDPTTNLSREKSLRNLGIDLAVKLAIEDCISLAHQIKKEKISLTIFSTNTRGASLLRSIPMSKAETYTDLLKNLISDSGVYRGRHFIHLWSYLLLLVMQEITGGYLYFLSRYHPELNLETLRIARADILSEIT
ncbi:MAG: VWA domain-containing protein [Candidatus Heimdallarchaeota archaeon]|nr:VWA domain-containing protein [Candidatus Heimdallarchaeota archaeon]